MSDAYTLEYWLVQNTGWSAGVSWYVVKTSRMEPLRYPTEEAARAYVATHRRDDPSMKWRIVHVFIEVVGNKRVTTETWTEL